MPPDTKKKPTEADLKKIVDQDDETLETQLQGDVEPEPTPEVESEPEPDEFETRFQERLRNTYGIYETPEEFRDRIAVLEHAGMLLPRMQAALEQQRVARPTAAPTIQAPPDDDQLRERARLDPYSATVELINRNNARMATLLQQRDRAMQETIRMNEARRARANRAAASVRARWPEAFDEKTQLSQYARQIFQQEMSVQERQSPVSPFVAMERAAARMGIPPRGNPARKTAAAPDTRAQNVPRAAKPRAVDEPQPTPLMSKMSSKMGIDPKLMAKVKDAKKTGKAVSWDGSKLTTGEDEKDG